jgi:oxygen-independent coproporphyrinogen III oxidase
VIRAIRKEIDDRHSYLKEQGLSSIYFGGGTPSLLSVDELAGIFSSLNKHFSWNDESEITLEANPDDITPGILKEWLSLGINRLSIGLQSFNDEELKWMNRAHNARQSESSVKMAQDAGFGNLTIDLIYGSRFQTSESWERTVSKAVSLGTAHISAYNLTIEKKTALGIQHSRGKEPAVDDQLSGSQFLLMRDLLQDNGFSHYEISNFAKEGFIARHNSNYWLGQPYLGIGPSAHSFDGINRQWNVSNNGVYTRALEKGAPYFELELLTPRNRYNEYILTRLRTIWGCDMEEMQRLFGEETLMHFNAQLKKHQSFIIQDSNIVRLNRNGLLRADGIASDLFL